MFCRFINAFSWPVNVIDCYVLVLFTVTFLRDLTIVITYSTV